MHPPASGAAHWNDKWIRVGFALTLVIFAAIAVSAYLGMSSYLSNTHSMAVSSDLHLQLNDLVSSLKDIQRGARGYVITGDTAFLTSFLEGTAHVRHGFEGLRKVAYSSAEEPGEVDTIFSTSERFIAITSRTIEFVEAGEPDSARAIVWGAEPNRALDRIDAIVRSIEEGEAHAAEERRSEAESDFNRSLVFLMLGTALNFALIIGLFLFMNRQIRNKRAAADLLRLGEERLQTVVNSIQEGITFSNAAGQFEVFNPRMTEITGYTAEEANRAGDFSALIYPDPAAHQRALDGVKLVMDHPGPHLSETTITTKSGLKKLLRVSSEMLGGKGREMFLATYADITEQMRLEQALRESEEKLRLIFEQALDGISVFEEAGDPSLRRLVECNPRYAELAGRSREELLARGSTGGLAVSLSEENVESIEGGIAFRGSFSWIRPDGRDNIVEYAAMPITMRGKKFTIGIDRDVTEARRADQLVRESQRRYQQLFEASPIPIMIYDPATLAMLEVNPATLDHYGYTRKELLAMTIKDIRPPEDLPGFLAFIEKEAHREERTSTWRHRRKDGSTMQVEVNSHAVTWKNHSARMLLVHDITDLLQVEEELRVQKTHFELLFESAPEGIALLDGHGNVQDINSAFARMFGLSKEEMIGRNIVAMTRTEEGKEETRRALKAVMDGVNVRMETRRRGRDGRQIDVSINAVPVDDGQGTNMAYVLCQDITQKKQGAREREDLIGELQKALAEVKTLGGLLPICAWCKKIRDDSGYYHQIESFIAKHSEAKFTHGICPDCRGKFDRDAGARARTIRKVPG